MSKAFAPKLSSARPRLTAALQAPELKQFTPNMLAAVQKAATKYAAQKKHSGGKLSATLKALTGQF